MVGGRFGGKGRKRDDVAIKGNYMSREYILSPFIGIDAIDHRDLVVRASGEKFSGVFREQIPVDHGIPEPGYGTVHGRVELFVGELSEVGKGIVTSVLMRVWNLGSY